jgi:hypothetical protein
MERHFFENPRRGTEPGLTSAEPGAIMTHLPRGRGSLKAILRWKRHAAVTTASASANISIRRQADRDA